MCRPFCTAAPPLISDTGDTVRGGIFGLCGLATGTGGGSAASAGGSAAAVAAGMGREPLFAAFFGGAGFPHSSPVPTKFLFLPGASDAAGARSNSPEDIERGLMGHAHTHTITPSQTNTREHTRTQSLTHGHTHMHMDIHTHMHTHPAGCPGLSLGGRGGRDAMPALSLNTTLSASAAVGRFAGFLAEQAVMIAASGGHSFDREAAAAATSRATPMTP